MGPLSVMGIVASMVAPACVGHRFVPPSTGSMWADPAPGESDVSLALGVDDALTPFLELPAVSARPGPPWRLEITGRAALAETRSNARTGIGLVAARGAFEQGPVAIGVGLGFTLFTFVATADLGVQETVRVGANTRVTLGVHAYVGVPLDDELGADINDDLGVIDDEDEPRPSPTAGGMAGVTFAQPISPAVEIRMALVARAFSDFGGALDIEGLWLVGVGFSPRSGGAAREPKKRKRGDPAVEWEPVPGYR